MRLFTRLIAVCLMTAALAACDPIAQAPAPGAAIGTRAVIKGYNQEMTAEITDVKGKLVVTEFQWQGGDSVVRGYYRGLFPVSGRSKTYHWEAEFDESKLEPLFPLAVGKEVAFSGTSRDVESGSAANFWASLSVIGEKVIELPNGARKVYVVDIITEYRKENLVKRKTNTVYYDPELSMVLKSVVLEDGYQSFWRVVSIDPPGEGNRATPSQQRRAGTVMI